MQLSIGTCILVDNCTIASLSGVEGGVWNDIAVSKVADSSDWTVVAGLSFCREGEGEISGKRGSGCAELEFDWMLLVPLLLLSGDGKRGTGGGGTKGGVC